MICFSINVKRVSACVCFSAGGLSVGGQPPAAQSTVSHVSLPRPGHPGPLPAPTCRQAAGHEREVHNHHPSNRYGDSCGCCLSFPPASEGCPGWWLSLLLLLSFPVTGAAEEPFPHVAFGAYFMCGPCLESNVVYRRAAGTRAAQWDEELHVSGSACRHRAVRHMDLLLLFLLVIDGLDFLKKEHAGARDSIRYLEAEFKKGNR